MTKKQQHKRTIKNHRKYVRQACFKMGIPLRGLLHDLSKYSKTEMLVAKYANGTKSPHEIAREELGYSPSWYHHYHKNDHHWEYWLDLSNGYINAKGVFVMEPSAIKMPYNCVIEMFCDFIGAGKAYSGSSWTTSTPLDYWNKTKKNRLLHYNTRALFENLLVKLSKFQTEEKFYKWYRVMRKALKSAYND